MMLSLIHIYGKITYDGININNIKKSDLRRSLGIVLQDTNLFTGTIRENIRYGNLDATDEEVHAAARLANADEFINMLPDGYDTVTVSYTHLDVYKRQESRHYGSPPYEESRMLHL